MRVPALPRWAAPALVVVFVLTSAWAGYNVVRVASAQPSGSPGPTVDYAGTGTYHYVASLLPNTLFNSTTVSGSNITLFVSITKTVNITVESSANLSRDATGSLYDVFTVVLTTAAWSKTIERATQANSSLNTTRLTVVDRYDLNVSRTIALVQSIDTELNYSATSFTVRLSSAVTGGFALDGGTSALALSSVLNLTFRGALIVPSGSTGTSHGSFVGAAGGDPPRGDGLTLAWVALAASLAALGGSLWLLWVDRRTLGAAPVPSLERLIEPYEEVIARTTRVPEGSRVVPVDRWDDLVKVADTLGRPILRPVGDPGDPVGVQFYVFDGAVAYLYRYPAAPSADAAAVPARPTAPPPAVPAAVPAAPPASAAPAPSVPSSPVTTVVAPASPPTRPAPVPKPVVATVPAPRPPPSVRGPSAPGSLPQQLKRELARIRSAPLDPAQRWYVFSLFSQAVHTVSSSPPAAGQRAVDELREAIDRALARPPGPA